MTVIFKQKEKFTSEQYDGVTNIAYNPVTLVYTITLADSSTKTYSASSYYMFVAIK